MTQPFSFVPTTHMDGEASYFPVTFDERLGLVLQMGFDPLPAWEPQIYLVTGRLSRDLLPDGTDTFRQRCISGHAFDPHEAVDAAVGEALERTFASYSHWETAATGDRDFVNCPSIGLERIPRFSDTELIHLGNSYGQPDSRAVRSWYPAESLATRLNVRVPAQLVFCPYHPPPSETLFWEPTTTGLAAGRGSEAAEVAGLLEVIERDALAVTWLLQLPGQELPLQAARKDAYPFVIHSLRRGSAEIRLALVTIDIPVPVCVAAIYDDSSMPHVAFGSSAALDVRTAAKKALCEAAFTRYTLKLGIALFGEQCLDPFTDDPKTYQEHGLAWARKESAARSTWIFGKRSIPCFHPIDSGERQNALLPRLVSMVSQAGYDVYRCDLSTPEIASAGWSIRRIIVPGLQPLNPGRYRRMLQSARVEGTHHQLKRPGKGTSVNSAVHPFC